MRLILLLLFIVPVLASAQINRSAKELAVETIGEYIQTKLFKDQPYHPLSFGELKQRQEENTDVSWSYVHKFEITEPKFDKDNKAPVIKTYTFTFYLDRRMRVKRAEGAFTN
jgi:hypothetical protein